MMIAVQYCKVNVLLVSLFFYLPIRKKLIVAATK